MKYLYIINMPNHITNIQINVQIQLDNFTNFKNLIVTFETDQYRNEAV